MHSGKGESVWHMNGDWIINSLLYIVFIWSPEGPIATYICCIPYQFAFSREFSQLEEIMDTILISLKYWIHTWINIYNFNPQFFTILYPIISTFHIILPPNLHFPHPDTPLPSSSRFKHCSESLI